MPMKRIFYYDNLKGLLTMFVVLGHTLTISSNYYNYDGSIFKICSFFMIPTFLIITEMFSRKSKKEPITRAKKMFIIYAIFQVIISLYYAYCLKIIRPSKSILIPRFTLWYLLTSAELYLVEYILRKNSYKKMILLSILIALFSGFIPFVTNTLSITRTLAFLPFFVIGYYQEDIKLFDRVKKHKKMSIVLVLVITVWFLFHQHFFLFKDTYMKYNYYAYSTPIICFLKRILLYIFSIIYSVFLFNMMPHKKLFFAKIGKCSLIIYLVHGVLLKTMKYFKLFLNNAFIGTLVLYTSTIAICIIIHFIIEKIKVLGGKKFDYKCTKLPKKESILLQETA